MISAIRAAVFLGGSSLVAIVGTLLTAKALAVIVGPSGVGIFGLMQALTDLAVLIAGLGVSVSLVRSLAGAEEGGDSDAHAAARSAAGILAWSLGGFAALVLIVRSEAISQALLGSADFTWTVILAAVAVPITLAAAANIATLSSARLVGTIAALRVAGAVALAVVTVASVATLGAAGSSLGILASSLMLALGSSAASRRGARSGRRPGMASIGAAARRLVEFGGPFAASAIVGTGVQLAIPIVVAVSMGTDAAGFYRAATQISAGYLALIAAAMLQDYYPRLAAHQTSAEEMIRLIDQQLRLVMILTVPLILFGIGLSDVIVPALYATSFAPAVGILGWQLAAMLLKLPSWTLAFAILARGRSRTYFLVELVGGIALFVGSAIGMTAFGLPGLGLAVLVTYLIYYPVVWFAVRHDLPLRVTPAQLLLLGTVLAVIVIQALPSLGFAGLRQPLALGLALASVIVAAKAGWSAIRRNRAGPRRARRAPWPES